MNLDEQELKIDKLLRELKPISISNELIDKIKYNFSQQLKSKNKDINFLKNILAIQFIIPVTVILVSSLISFKVDTSDNSLISQFLNSIQYFSHEFTNFILFSINSYSTTEYILYAAVLLFITIFALNKLELISIEL
ncbi:MAG: hypothetical protein EXR24_07260 [Ignavibacteria bacterium]|nr:hypothetical protein [Bacteroidota bacterium]MSQ46753.1 hypothetical protein [Ignavibacteria bacterium]